MRHGIIYGISRLTRAFPVHAVAASVLAISLCFASPSTAKDASRGKTNVPLRQQVVVADQLVMVIQASAGGHTPAERVDKINDRLVEIISTERLIPSAMHLAKSHGQTVIMVGKHLLASVTTADAAANSTTVPVLAHFWLANLKRVLPQARPETRLP